MTVCLWLVCTLLAIIGSLYAVFSGVLAASLLTGSEALKSESSPISVLKPLHRAEAGLGQNLATFFQQNYAGEIQMVCGVQDAADPAIPIVEALKTTFPRQDIVLATSTKPVRGNPKIANIIGLYPSARHDIIVLSDSDMSVPPDYACRIVAALHEPGVGLVTCLYRGRAVAGLWSRLAAAAVDQHFLPAVLVGMRLGLANPCFGSTIALRRETLERIGGFEAFADTLADDYAIGEAVRRLGLAVAIPPFTIGHTFAEQTLAEVIGHELRWTKTIRLVDPWGYLGSLVTHPLPFAIAALCLSGFSATGFAILLATLACRLFVPLQVERLPGGGKSAIWLSPLRDLLSFAVFVASFIPGEVQWRGRSYRVAPDGSVTPT